MHIYQQLFTNQRREMKSKEFLSTLGLEEWTVLDCSKKKHRIYGADLDICVPKCNRPNTDFM